MFQSFSATKLCHSHAIRAVILEMNALRLKNQSWTKGAFPVSQHRTLQAEHQKVGPVGIEPTTEGL